jgi:hypothetical protein
VFGRVAWFLTLLNGFWILLSTQLGLTDAFARTATDMLWSASPKVRSFVREDARKVYYALLLFFALFGMWAITQATPGMLIITGAFISGMNFVLLGTHVLVVHRRLLPPALRMPRWREIAIGALVLMFVCVTYLGIQSKWDDIMKAIGLR